MSKRKDWTADVLSLLHEADYFLKMLRQDQVVRTDLRLREWRDVTSSVLLFAFGELSPYYREWHDLDSSESIDRSVHYYQLSRCLQLARRALQKHRLPNGDLEVPDGYLLPDYQHNRSYERERIVERTWWRMFWSGFTFGKYKL